jgi:hypothetical protein
MMLMEPLEAAIVMVMEPRNAPHSFEYPIVYGWMGAE